MKITISSRLILHFSVVLIAGGWIIGYAMQEAGVPEVKNYPTIIVSLGFTIVAAMCMLSTWRKEYPLFFLGMAFFILGFACVVGTTDITILHIMGKSWSSSERGIYILAPSVIAAGIYVFLLNRLHKKVLILQGKWFIS